jgi:preprotein translocase subunit Sss1
VTGLNSSGRVFGLARCGEENEAMKTATIAGIVLLLLGVVSLVYQGISYITQKQVVDIGPIHATEDQKHNIPLPPVLGGILMVGGIVLLMTGSEKAIH